MSVELLNVSLLWAFSDHRFRFIATILNVVVFVSAWEIAMNNWRVSFDGCIISLLLRARKENDFRPIVYAPAVFHIHFTSVHSRSDALLSHLPKRNKNKIKKWRGWNKTGYGLRVICITRWVTLHRLMRSDGPARENSRENFPEFSRGKKIASSIPAAELGANTFRGGKI